MEQMYESVIGLEVHVELATQTKIFCGCPAAFGGEPNVHTCPVCTGMPGALPVLNRQVVSYALAVGLAVNCHVNQYCRFDRKNYFYPDKPQNYQISQLYLPICYDGGIEIKTADGKKRIGIHEIHMEEDAGKLIHSEAADYSLVDFNRSGVPLIEIVSEPDMRNVQEVLAYLENLRLLIRYLEASDCKLQEGSMRVDVNLSVREVGDKRLGTRTEMKNLNSFRAIKRAIEHERSRQIELLSAGQAVAQETRRWDDMQGQSLLLRSKADAEDYRYFPDPDLPALVIHDAWIQEIQNSQPELPAEKIKRYRRDFELSEYDARLLTESKHLADIFEASAEICKKPKKVANWLLGETLRLLKEQKKEPAQLIFSPGNLAQLIDLIDEGGINSTVAKEVFAKVFNEDIEPRAYVAEKGLGMISDEEALSAVVRQVIAEHPQSVEDYHNGKKKAIGFLIGKAMKEMDGKADPMEVSRILKGFF